MKKLTAPEYNLFTIVCFKVVITCTDGARAFSQSQPRRPHTQTDAQVAMDLGCERSDRSDWKPYIPFHQTVLYAAYIAKLQPQEIRFVSLHRGFHEFDVLLWSLTLFGCPVRTHQPFIKNDTHAAPSLKT